MTGSKTSPKIAELGNNTFPMATPCTKDLVDPQKSAAIRSSREKESNRTRINRMPKTSNRMHSMNSANPPKLSQEKEANNFCEKDSEKVVNTMERITV